MTDVVALKLVDKRTKIGDEIIAYLEEYLKMARENPFTSLAMICLRDGNAFVVTRGSGDRLTLLGAVTDLQYTLMKSGDPS